MGFDEMIYLLARVLGNIGVDDHAAKSSGLVLMQGILEEAFGEEEEDV